jgi:squalene cyclase
MVAIEYTSDPNPGLNSTYHPVTGMKVGLGTNTRLVTYKASLSRAAIALSATDWPYKRNIRTTAQTIIGLNAALPYLVGTDAQAARQRIEQVASYLRSQQRDDGSWQDATDDGFNFPQALP